MDGTVLMVLDDETIEWLLKPCLKI